MLFCTKATQDSVNFRSASFPPMAFSRHWRDKNSFETSGVRGMPTILGVNVFFGVGGGLKPWRNKAENSQEKFAEEFAEKLVGRQTRR